MISREATDRVNKYLDEIAAALGNEVERSETRLYHKELRHFLSIREKSTTGYRSRPMGQLYVTVEAGYEPRAKKFHERKGQLDTQAVIEYSREYIASKLASKQRQKYFDALKDVSEAELRLAEERLGGRLYSISAVLLQDGKPGAQFKLTVPTSELERALKLIEENEWKVG